MGRNVMLILYFALMVGIIVAVDVLFFRNRFLERLLANVGIVGAFVAIYFVFLRRP
jgi:hypothetical protein